MAWEFQICRIEWTPSGETITCMDIGSSVFEYFPSSPALAISRTQGRRRGSVPIAHATPNVMETVRVKFAAASYWTGFRALEAALERALQWSEGDRRDMRSVLRFRDTARHGSTYYETPLYDGRITQERGPILTLTWERGPYWTGPEVPLPVVNNWVTYSGEVTPGAGGYYDYAQVTNADDGTPTRCNWVIVTPPSGDVPTPIRLRMQNNYESGRLRAVRVGWNDRPQALVLEGEDAQGATVTNGTQYSNMAVGAATTFKWVIEQSTVRDFTGPFRVFANGNLAGKTWRVATGYALTRKQYGTRAAVEGESGWTDLGVLSFPPGGYVHPTRYPVTVWLDGSGEGTLDYLVFIPQRQQRWLAFTEGYNCQPGACIEDDGWRGELVLEHDGQRVPILEGFGDAIEAWPSGLLPGSARQMLTFTLESDTGGATADRSAIVQVFARPHYRTLP